MLAWHTLESQLLITVFHWQQTKFYLVILGNSIIINAKICRCLNASELTLGRERNILFLDPAALYGTPYVYLQRRCKCEVPRVITNGAKNRVILI